MSWNAAPRRAMSELDAMTPEQRERMTFPEASLFLSPDTLERARWAELKYTGWSAYECLLILKRLPDPRKRDTV